MTQLKIRAAMLADIPAITAIYSAAVTGGTASFELDAPDGSEMQRRWQVIQDAGFPYLVAEKSSIVAGQAGTVIGYAYVNQYRPRPAYRYSVENSIYVAPEAHRSGIGRQLLATLIDSATAKGYRQMIAVIGDSAQSASIGLHRRAGFTFVGTVHSVGYKHGRWLDSVIMQRALGDGDTSSPSE